MTAPRPGSRVEQRRRTEARILDAAAQAFLAATPVHPGTRTTESPGPGQEDSPGN